MTDPISTHIRNNAVGYVALFLALSGTAWAGAQIGPNEIRDNAVRSNHIKNGQVAGADVAPAAITGVKVADDSVGGQQVDEASLDAATLQRRVEGQCPGGEAIKGIAEDGSVACESAGGGGPPSGPAGGDLSGSYPDPQIAADGVGSAEVGANALTGADIDEPSLDREVIQARIFETCPPGSAMISVFGSGHIVCRNFIRPDDPAGGDLAGTYPSPQLAAGSVGAGELADGSVGTTKLADGAVSKSKLASGSVGSAQLEGGAVTAGKVGIGAVGAFNIAGSSISSGHVVDGSLTDADLGQGAVGTSETARVPAAELTRIQLDVPPLSTVDVNFNGGGSRFDPLTMWNGSTRLTVPVTGWYLTTAQVTWSDIAPSETTRETAITRWQAGNLIEQAFAGGRSNHQSAMELDHLGSGNQVGVRLYNRSNEAERVEVELDTAWLSP